MQVAENIQVDPFASTMTLGSREIPISAEALALVYLFVMGYSDDYADFMLGAGARRAAGAELAGIGFGPARARAAHVTFLGHDIRPPGADAGIVTAADLLQRRLAEDPDGVLFVVEDPEDGVSAELTVTECAAMVETIARRMCQEGLRRGDVLAADATPCLETAMFILAGWSLGVIFASVREIMPDESVAPILRRMAPKILLSARDRCRPDGCRFLSLDPADPGASIDAWLDETRERAAMPPQPVGPDDPAYVVLSSGSTGVPKAMVLSFRSVQRTLMSTQAALDARPGTRGLSVVDLASVGGLRVLLGESLLPGNSGLILSRRTRESSLSILNAVSAHGVTYLNALPATFRAAIAAGEDRLRAADFARLGTVMSGSAALHAAEAAALAKLLEVRVFDNYGASEFSGALLITDGSPSRTIVTGGGRPFDMLVRVLDEHGAPCAAGQPGRLHVFGDRLMLGYWKDGGIEPRRPGWFPTEDIVLRQQDGSLRVVGRTHGMIKTAEGEFLSPADVEGIVGGIAGVRGAVAIALPSDAGRQESYAVFVETDATGEDFRAGVERAIIDRLGRAARPGRILLLGAIPLAGQSKPDRGKLLQLVQSDGSPR